MSDIFTTTDYSLRNLVDDIEMGRIGLPDIQRPFVWPDSKVRDLFDSLHRGFPVGHLLFWKNGSATERVIGHNKKRKHPELVVVDGQQRLTSLYAILKGAPITDKNWNEKRIRIAFNPMTGKFEVANVAISKDKSWIPDISVVFADSSYTVIRNYLDANSLVRQVDAGMERRIEKNIERLHRLETFNFTALELNADAQEDVIAEVFVRINSKGQNLKQADFVLTLMSVFWEDGRKNLEAFCRDAKQPSANPATSPYNHIIRPDPSQLLRPSVALAFRRASIRHVYSILRGKNLATRVFSEEMRDQQFERLERAQAQTLNLRHWHDFLSCIRMAGYRTRKMIWSDTNLLFSYTLYLIGRTEYAVDEMVLRRTIAQWFFMSAMTRRFSASSETVMEKDLAALQGKTTADDFVGTLKQICDTELTRDYWNIALPNTMKAAWSPSFEAYLAAMVVLDAPVLFSNVKLADVLDPATALGLPIDKHHLFPKSYLKTLGFDPVKDANRIANYTYMERTDNIRIGDQSPKEYVPRLKQRFDTGELERMASLHALPANWEEMEYQDFLESRRELMAAIVKKGYDLIAAEAKDSTGVQREKPGEDLLAIIAAGETSKVEFKSSLRTNLHTNSRDGRMESAVLKTLAAFMNTDGGRLVVGVADDGAAIGVDVDGFANEDKMHLHLMNVVSGRCGAEAATLLDARFESYGASRVLVVDCRRSRRPVYVKEGDTQRFFVRTGPATRELTGGDLVSYVDGRGS